MKNEMLAVHCDDGSICGDRSYEQLVRDGFREDPSVFAEGDTLDWQLRDEIESFYDRIDADLCGKGEW